MAGNSVQRTSVASVTKLQGCIDLVLQSVDIHIIAFVMIWITIIHRLISHCIKVMNVTVLF